MLPHESSDQPIIDALRKRPIVEAVVLESHDPTGAIVVTTQRIDHAYCGGSELEGRTFYESSAGPRYAGNLRGAPPISPPLKVNESGIFLLRRLDDDRLIRYAPPARRGVEAEFGDVKQLAEAAETLWNSDDEPARLALLMAYVKSDAKALAIWASGLMGETHPSEALSLARAWSNAGPALNTMITLDEALCRSGIPKDQWQDSDERHALLQRLRKALNDAEVDASRLLDRLGAAIQRKEIDPEWLLALVKSIGDDSSLAPRVQQRAAHLLTFVVNDPQVGAEAIDWLLDAMEQGQGAPLFLTAVFSIGPAQALTREQLSRLIVIRDAEQVRAASDPGERNPAVRTAKLLAEVIKRCNAQPASRPSP